MVKKFGIRFFILTTTDKVKTSTKPFSQCTYIVMTILDTLTVTGPLHKEVHLLDTFRAYYLRSVTVRTQFHHLQLIVL